MHPVRKQRLYLVLFVVLFSSIAVGLVVYGLRGNINLFFPPAEVAAGKAPVGQQIRVGGMVVDGSIQRSDSSLKVRFEVTDYQAKPTRLLTAGARSAYRVNEPPTTKARNTRINKPRAGSVAKACTLVKTPDRTRKVPSKLREKAKIARSTVQLLNKPRFSVAASE